MQNHSMNFPPLAQGVTTVRAPSPRAAPPPPTPCTSTVGSNIGASNIDACNFFAAPQVTITGTFAPGSRLSFSYPLDAEGPSPPGAAAADALAKMSNLSPAAQDKGAGLIAAHVARGVPVGGYLEGGIEPVVPEGSLSPGPRGPISVPVQGDRSMPYGHHPTFSPDGPTAVPVAASLALRQPAFGANETPPEAARFASDKEAQVIDPEDVRVCDLARGGPSDPLACGETLSDLEERADLPCFDGRGRFFALVQDSDDDELEVECSPAPFELSALRVDRLEIGKTSLGEYAEIEFAAVIRCAQIECLENYALGRWTYEARPVSNLCWIPECRSNTALPYSMLFTPVANAPHDLTVLPHRACKDATKLFWHTETMDHVLEAFPLSELNQVADYVIQQYKGLPEGGIDSPAAWAVTKEAIYMGLIEQKLQQMNPAGEDVRVREDGSISTTGLGKRSTRATTKAHGKDKELLEAEKICGSNSWGAAWKVVGGKWKKIRAA